MRFFIRRADIFQADTEPISSCRLNKSNNVPSRSRTAVYQGVIHQVPETAPQHSTSVSYKIFGISKYHCEFWSNGHNKTAPEVEHIFICPPHGGPVEMLFSMIRTILSCPFHAFPMNYVSAVIYGAPCSTLLCSLALKPCMDFSQGANWEKQNCSI